MKTPIPAIDRARKVVAKMAPALAAIVDAVAAKAAEDDVALEAEFGPGQVALIRACQQFARVHGSGHVELRLSPEDEAALMAAGCTAMDPEGQVFKILGWRRFDLGAPEALQGAVVAAYERAA